MNTSTELRSVLEQHMPWYNIQQEYEEATALANKYANGGAPEQTPAKTDSCDISPEAQELLKAAEAAQASAVDEIENEEAAEPEELAFNPIWSHTARDGTLITLEAAKNNAPDSNEFQAVRVTFTGPDGNSHTETLSDSAVLSRGEDGTWVISYAEITEDGRQLLQGSDADDILIALPSSKNSEYTEINAGDGDNVVIDLTSGHTKITTGSGNDSIVGFGGGSYDVASGDGDDDIYLIGSYARVDAGGGNDKIDIAGAIGVDIDAGDGDDFIKIEGHRLYKSTIKGGTGDDSITITSLVANSVISGDEGNDTITINQGVNKDSLLTSLSGVTNSYISGGDGDDIITFNTGIGYSTVDGGNGDDVITTKPGLLGSVFSSQIFGGAGNDQIDVSFLNSSIINGGDGDDSINVDIIFQASTINGDAGDDSISIGSILLYGSEINGGDGDDAISIESDLNFNPDSPRIPWRGSYLFVNSYADSTTISGGSGNDTITVGRSHGSKISGGDGDDTITVSDAFSSIIDGGGGNDRINVENAQRAEILGGDGDDTITVENAYHSGIGGGDGDDDLKVDTASESVISGDALNWNRQAVIGKYLKSALEKAETAENAGVNSVAEGAASAEAAPEAIAGQREMTDHEIFIDALMRSDKSHPLVKKILERHENRLHRII